MKSKNIVTGTIIFSVITFFPPAVNLLLMPIYIKYLSIQEYGVLSLITSISAFFTVVGGMRVSTAITSYYYELQQEPAELQMFYGNTLKFSLLSNLVLYVLSCLPIYLIIKYVFEDPAIHFASMGLPAIGIGLISSTRSCYLMYCKNDRDIRRYSIQYIVVTVSMALLQLLLIAVFHYGVEGLLIARLSSEVIGLSLILISEKKVLLLPFKKEYVRKALKFSLPLIPSGIIGWVYTFGDRAFIETYLDLSMLGLYGFLVTLISLITMLSDAMMHGIQPYLYNLYSEGIEKNTSKINEIYKSYLQAVIVFGSLLVLIGNNLDLIISNTDYQQVSKYVAIGVMIFIAEAYYKIFFNNLLYSKNTRWISMMSIASVVMTVSFYFIFIPLFQIWGVIFANLLSNIISTAVSWILSQKKLHLSLSRKDLIVVPLVELLILGAFQLCVALQEDHMKLLSLLQLAAIGCVSLFVLRKSFVKVIELYKKMIY
ncbi:MAG: polysaccharide biosynthesis protein [Chitinophagaceae bacterium]|nr:polysaccharide biosynthesis protein [Chitinophagaceae bacterium]